VLQGHDQMALKNQPYILSKSSAVELRQPLWEWPHQGRGPPHRAVPLRSAAASAFILCSTAPTSPRAAAREDGLAAVQPPCLRGNHTSPSRASRGIAAWARRTSFFLARRQQAGLTRRPCSDLARGAAWPEGETPRASSAEAGWLWLVKEEGKTQRFLWKALWSGTARFIIAHIGPLVLWSGPSGGCGSSPRRIWGRCPGCLAQGTRAAGRVVPALRSGTSSKRRGGSPWPDHLPWGAGRAVADRSRRSRGTAAGPRAC